MGSTRRLFLLGSAGFTVANAFPLSMLARNNQTDEKDTFDAENLAIFAGISQNTFEPWTGSSFRVSLNGKSIGSLILRAVETVEPSKEPAQETFPTATRMRALTVSSKVPEVTTFMLRFSGAVTSLTQNTYTLDHDWLGTFPLFLVPSGLSGGRITCTAVISQLKGSSAARQE